MNLLPFLLINLGAFAILHFAWLPSLERRMRLDRSIANIRRAATLSLLGFARSVFLVGTLTTAAVIIILLILQTLGGVTAAEVTSAVESVHRWRALLLGFGPVWGGIVITLLVLALGFHARRSGRIRMEKTFQKLYEKRLEQLRKDFELGNLKELPPTEEMKQVAAKLVELSELLNVLEVEEFLNRPDVIAARLELVEQIDMLQKYYMGLDVQRRLELELDPDEAAMPEARTKWERLQTFFMSQGLLASLNKTSRALFVASLLLLVPSLISVYSVSTAATLNSQLVELKNLRVELSRKEFEQEKLRLGEPINRPRAPPPARRPRRSARR